MITLDYISCFFTSLIMICNIFILFYTDFSVKKYFILFFSFFIPSCLQIYLDFPPILFLTLLLNSILLIIFSKKIYTALFIPFAYILNCIIIYLIAFLFSFLSEYSFEYLNTNVFSVIILSICTIIVNSLIFYCIRLIICKYIISTFEKINKKTICLLGLTILFCAFLIYTLCTFLGIVDISNSEYFMLIFLLILYFIFTISIIFIALRYIKKNYEAQKKVEYMENLNEYTKNLEMVYNNLRSFKHDYINIMTALSLYIDEKKYDELETFFYEHILPMQKNLTQKNETLNKLLHVNVLELKSILYTKLLLAVNREIDVNLDIPDEIDSINMDPVDLTRMLGIYLDNAIEACLETEHPIINFHLGKLNNTIVFIISNTYIDKGLSVAQMQKKEVTTKGDGHGIGLYNVSEILNRYDNIYHETLTENDLFIQQVHIS